MSFTHSPVRSLFHISLCPGQSLLAADLPAELLLSTQVRYRQIPKLQEESGGLVLGLLKSLLSKKCLGIIQTNLQHEQIFIGNYDIQKTRTFPLSGRHSGSSANIHELRSFVFHSSYLLVSAIFLEAMSSEYILEEWYGSREQLQRSQFDFVQLQFLSSVNLNLDTWQPTGFLTIVIQVTGHDSGPKK